MLLIFQASCLPPLKWDDELEEVGQVWADQCAMVLYTKYDPYPKIYHEESGQRTTSMFGHPPGIGQNVAWVLTKDDNFTDYIGDLWFRDTRCVCFKFLESVKMLKCEIVHYRVSPKNCGTVFYHNS